LHIHDKAAGVLMDYGGRLFILDAFIGF